jgi:shikimate 5-dehydrogenase
VVAVAIGAGGSSLSVARAIAVQGEEELVVVEGTTPSDIAAALGDTRERLIVMMRGLGDGSELAAVRGVAVLVVEPEMIAGDPA